MCGAALSCMCILGLWIDRNRACWESIRNARRRFCTPSIIMYAKLVSRRTRRRRLTRRGKTPEIRTRAADQHAGRPWPRVRRCERGDLAFRRDVPMRGSRVSQIRPLCPRSTYAMLAAADAGAAVFPKKLVIFGPADAALLIRVSRTLALWFASVVVRSFDVFRT